MEPDIMVISVRHVPFRDADEVLSRWNPLKQGYLFSIVAPDKDTTDYLNQKYLPKRTNRKGQKVSLIFSL